MSLALTNKVAQLAAEVARLRVEVTRLREAHEAIAAELTHYQRKRGRKPENGTQDHATI